VKQIVLLLGLLGLLAVLTGCRTADRHAVETGPYAVQDASNVVGFVNATITVEVPDNPSKTVTINSLSASIYEVVESNLGFARFDGLVSTGRVRSLVELFADARGGTVDIDLEIRVPEDVWYKITSHHDEIPGFTGLSFEWVEGKVKIDDACGRLKAGTYRVSGEYKVPNQKCMQVEWTLELNRAFRLPPARP
jgi:hypothetical protein